jgi:hypothetical protein
MKLRRKFLRMVDLRVQHYLAGQRSNATSRLSRLHSIESLASDHSDYKTSHALEAVAETSQL